jgi:hypothetical protein
MTRCPDSFVIVDRSLDSNYRVRNSLLRAGFNVHVFGSYSAALMLLQHKKVESVILAFDNDKPTADFCNAVRRLKIPIVYAAPPAKPHDVRKYAFQINFSQRRDSPTIFLPYRSHRLRDTSSISS